MSSGMHSTGRGGAGNIGPDSGAVYVDGAILREQVHPGSGGGSAGRGGAGNMVPGDATTAGGVIRSEDVIPEPAMHTTHQQNYHTGRGGEGNVHRDYEQQHQHGGLHGLVDKAKHAVGMDNKQQK